MSQTARCREAREGLAAAEERGGLMSEASLAAAHAAPGSAAPAATAPPMTASNAAAQLTAAAVTAALEGAQLDAASPKQGLPRVTSADSESVFMQHRAPSEPMSETAPDDPGPKSSLPPQVSGLLEHILEQGDSVRAARLCCSVIRPLQPRAVCFGWRLVCHVLRRSYAPCSSAFWFEA